MMLDNISWENSFLKGKTTQGHKCKIKCLNQTFSKNYNCNWFFTIKDQGLAKSLFDVYHHFLKYF
jgi:hypothetical protein